MANKLLLVYMFIDYGRMGELDGMFVCDQVSLDRIYGREVCFGEALGKHSEVVETMAPEMFEVKSDDQQFIKKFVSILGFDVSGINPFDYLRGDNSEGQQQLCPESIAFLASKQEAPDVL